ncbi:DNRLRE domain-containing protein [Pimelobacter simplex]|uniref:DNRLRE domain-containing protein n=1 Tax=Nocardioides simplex TaxID=2045 RepID=UPI0037F36B9A
MHRSVVSARIRTLAPQAVLGTAMSLGLAMLAVPVSPAPAIALEPSKAKVAERPDRTSAMVTALQQDARVEDLSARTPSSSTYANPDGTWTLESYAGVVRSETEAGEWVAVDPTLRPTTDGAAGAGGARSGEGVEPVAVPFSVAYGDGGSKDLATVATPSGGELSVDWAAKLPAATVADTTVTYADPGAGTEPGDQVVVTSHPEGFNFSVTLDQAPAGAHPEYRFPLALSDVPGGRFKERADGTIDILANASSDAVDSTPSDKLRVVATITAPVMWDSADEPTQVPVTAALEGTGTDRVLVLRPDPGYLADPARVYPVTVDPTVVLAATGDTWVQNLVPNTSQYTSPELRVGTSSLGVNQSRSYLTFDTSALGSPTAASVVDAKVTLSNFEAGSCSGQPIRLSQITSTWTVSGLTWANQPTTTTAGSATTDVGKGATGCTAEGTVDFDATAIVKSWVGGTTNYGVQIRADNAGANASWRKYRSLENGDNTKAPKLTVTINQNPDTPTGLTTDSGGYGNWVRSKTPTLSAVVTDPDGGQVKSYFEVKQSGTLIWSGTSTAVASGGTASLQVPTGKLVEGGTYGVYAYGEDTNGARSTSFAGTQIRVDTIAPTVAISSAQFTNGSWKATLPSSDTVTYTGSSDTGFFWVNYDGVRVSAGANTSGVAVVPYTPTAGWHTLEVTPVDRAGNYGTPVTFAYGTGTAAFTTPSQWTPSNASFPIDLSGPASATGATLQWRLYGASTWATATKLKKADGTSWTGTVTGTGRSSTGGLTWNATEEPYGTGTLTGAVVVEVKGCFHYSGSADSCTTTLYLPLFESGFGDDFPTTSLGPAQVALTSGEAMITESDAADSKAGIGRTFASLSDGTLNTGLFGPGWSDPQILAPQPDAAAEIVDNRTVDGTIVVVDTDGGAQVFSPVSGSGGTSFKPLQPTGDATAVTFTAGTGGSPDKLELSSPLGAASTVTTWEWATSDTGAAAGWVLKATDAPGASNDIAVTSTNKRPTFIRQSDPTAATTCTASAQTVGCRALKITYSGTAASTRVSRVERVIGAATPGAVTTKTLANYTYTAGQLTKVCGTDPDGAGSAVPLCTEYTYTTAAGRTMLATMKPAGLTAWRFAYDTLGRLLNVKRQRPAASGGDATWSIDYSLTPASSGLPTMTSAKVSEWGQQVAPTRVYAVYEPFTGSSSVTKANLYYTDNAGRTTNTATYGPAGWLIGTNWYDSRGNTVQQLDTTGWARVQAAAVGDRPRIAAEASNYTLYNTWGGADVAGTRIVDEYGPASTATLRDGTIGLFRSHTALVYDDDPNVDPALISGRPGALGLGLTVKETLSAASADRTADYDLQVKTFGYGPIVSGDGNGWSLGRATSTSTKMSSTTWSTEVVRIDTDGRVIETRQPGAGAGSGGAGSDAHSTIFRYYTAGGTGDCANQPAWVGQVCEIGPAGQPSGTPIPVTRNTAYNSDLEATVVEDRASSGPYRTTTFQYDALSRPTGRTVETTGSGVAADTVSSQIEYDPSSGLQTSVSADGKSVFTSYDSWGRISTYTDASGKSSTLQYDSAGRVQSVDDGTVETTLSYGERGELIAATADNGIGAFSYSYETNGAVSGVVYPNGFAATFQTNEIGATTGRRLERSGTKLAMTAQIDAHGKIVAQTSPESSQRFVLDSLDRLIEVRDTTASGCTTRAYGFTSSSERASRTTYGPAAGGGCQANTPSATLTHSHDSANRITDSGYTYDPLGRSTTLPSSQTTGGPGSGNLNAEYRSTDSIKALSQDQVVGASLTTQRAEYTQDPTGRPLTVTFKSAGVETRRLEYRYSGAADVPTEVRQSTDAGATWTTTTYLQVPGLNLAVSKSGTEVTYHHANLHGDVVATTNSAGNVVAYGETDEFGNARSGAASTRYGWLGAYQRSKDAPSGIVLVGARLYNPVTGSFMTIDPILGGNATRYSYPEDPINQLDVSGCRKCKKGENWRARDTDYYRRPKETTWKPGAKSLYKFIDNFTSTLDWIWWQPGVHISPTGVRTRYETHYARDLACKTGVKYWVYMSSTYYVVQGRFKVEIGAGPLKKKLWEGWIGNPAGDRRTEYTESWVRA